MRTSLNQRQRLERDALQIQHSGKRSIQHVESVASIEGYLDPGRLREAVSRLHSSVQVLKSQFLTVDAVELEAASPELVVLGPCRETEGYEALRESTLVPFNLGTGPAWGCTLVQLESDRSLLALTADHLLLDGYSIGLLQDLLGNAYRCGERWRPDPEPLPYYEWAALQRCEVATRLESTVSWYSGLFGPETPVPEAWLREPVGNSMLAEEVSYERASAAVAEIRLTAADAQAVRQRAMAYRTTPYTVLLSAYMIALTRVAERLDGVFLANANRRSETLGTVGWLANLVIVPNRIDGRMGMAEAMPLVVQDLSRVAEHSYLPVSMLVDRLHPGRRTDGRRHPWAYFDYTPFPIWQGGQLPGVGKISLVDLEPEVTAVPGISTWIVEGPRGQYAIRTLYEKEHVSREMIDCIASEMLAALNPERSEEVEG